MQERKNRKRRAQPMAIELGDTVLMKRHIKSKNQIFFDPKEYRVIGKNHGDITVKSGSGKIFKRNVVQLKKKTRWHRNKRENVHKRFGEARNICQIIFMSWMKLKEIKSEVSIHFFFFFCCFFFGFS
jgi:hypothetical protein